MARVAYPPVHSGLHNEQRDHLNIVFEGKLTSYFHALFKLDPGDAITTILHDKIEDHANRGLVILKYDLLLMSSGLLVMIQILTESSLVGGSCLICSKRSTDMVGGTEQPFTLYILVVISYCIV